MDYTFENCRSLISLDLSDFDTSMVETMIGTFSECINLISLNISNFNTSLVFSMDKMFYKCISLISIDLSGFNTSLVILMNNMFYECSNLSILNLSNFNFNSALYLNDMFVDCSSLEYINIYNFDISKLSQFPNKFKGIMDNIVFCIYSNDDYNTENILLEKNLKKCPIKDCSMNWKKNKKRFIENKEICIDNCYNDDTYKYEFKFKCYDKCPKGTHSIKDNIFFCEKNLNECLAKYPFISLLDNSCLEECNSKEFFNNICTINNIKNYTIIQSTLISTIRKEIKNGTLDKLLRDVLNKKKDIIKKDKDILYQITSSFNQNNNE